MMFVFGITNVKIANAKTTINAALLSAVASSPRLIHVGWDNPSSAYVAKNWATMDKARVFDGITLNISTDDGIGLTQKLFSRHDFTKFRFARSIADIKLATSKWQRRGTLTDNFAWLMLSPEDWTPEGKNFSWADDTLWEQIAKNAGVMARFAKQAKLKGLFLDPEQYNATKFLSCEYMWAAGRDNFKTNPGCTPEDNPRVPAGYLGLLQKRGRQMMTSILREFPDIVIMTTMGHSAVRYNGAGYNLYAGFLDGVLSAMRDAPRAVLHDGMEMYGLRTLQDSPHCKEIVGFECLFNDARAMGNYFTSEPQLFQKTVKHSPAVWIDTGRKWNDKPNDFSGNYYSPAQLATAIESARAVSTGYVWIYSETACFFSVTATCKPIGEAYLTAMRQARAQTVKPVKK